MKNQNREEKQPQWQFNLRRISTSRAEILDLNKSKNGVDSKSKQKSNFKSFDDYMGTLRRERYKMTAEQQNELQKLASIKLINKPLLENLSSVNETRPVIASEYEDVSSSEMSAKSDDDIGVVNGSTVAGEQEPEQANYGIDFDVSVSLVDQINAIKKKLQNMKSLNSETKQETTTSTVLMEQPVKSKIEFGILKANSKSAKMNANTMEKPQHKEESKPKLLPITNESLSVQSKTISPECILERLTKLGASTVSNENFPHVVSAMKHSRCLQASCTQTATILPYLKCELIFGERFYWVVKLKRLYRNLFQIKLIKSIGPTFGMSQTMSLSNLSNVNLPAPNSNSVTQKRNSENFDPETFKPDTFQNDTNNISPNTSTSSIANSEKSDNKSTVKGCQIQSDDTFLFSTDIKLPTFCENLRPIGWSKANGYFVQKLTIRQLTSDPGCFSKRPHSVDYDNTEIKEFFTNYLDAVNSFRQDSHCELEDNQSNTVDIVRVKSNVAGRLLIEFAGSGEQDWIFFSDTRLHPLGWARKNKLDYSARSQCLENLVLDEEKRKLANPSEESDDEPTQHELRHERQQFFKLNHYLEVLHMNKFYVGRVCEVQSDVYFKVKLFTKNKPLDGKVLKFYLSSNVLSTLFPCKWCSKYNLILETPNDWDDSTRFDWDTYIDQMNATEAVSIYAPTVDLSIYNWNKQLNNLSEKFHVGSYLECVDTTSQRSTKIGPSNDLICLAQIKAKLAHLVFVKLIKGASQSVEANLSENSTLHIYSVDSLNLFPVGWCEMNNYYGSYDRYIRSYPFPNSNKDALVSSRIKENLKLSSERNIAYFSQFKNEEAWCDRIYLNVNCNSGPYFTPVKSKLILLPQSFGPGPIPLVVAKLIQMLIKVSDKPVKLLKHLQNARRNVTIASSNHTSDDILHTKNSTKMRLKAKDKGKYIFRDLEVCTQFSQLQEYLNDLCHKLKCCHKMLSISKPSKSPAVQIKNTICAESRCCLYCTINYFSSTTSTTLEQNQQKSLAKANPAQSSNQNGTGSSQTLRQKPSQSSIPKSKSLGKLVSIQDPSSQNHSPIKTRQNVRQTLLQQEELERIQFVKENNDKISKGAKASDIEIVQVINSTSDQQQRRMKHRHRASNEGEPPHVKKVRRENSTSDLDTDSLHQHSMNTSNNSMLNQTPTNNTMISGLNLNANNYHNGSCSNNTSLNSSFNASGAMLGGIDSNPIHWQTDEVIKYLLENKFDQHLNLIKEHEIDGQSFLMLTLPNIQNYMKLKLGPAIKLAHLVEKLKLIYFNHFKP